MLQIKTLQLKTLPVSSVWKFKKNKKQNRSVWSVNFIYLTEWDQSSFHIHTHKKKKKKGEKGDFKIYSKSLSSQALRNSDGNSFDNNDSFQTLVHCHKHSCEWFTVSWLDLSFTTSFQSKCYSRKTEKNKTKKQTKHLALLNRFLKGDKESLSKIKSLINTGIKY